jgi:hypothetical protein
VELPPDMPPPEGISYYRPDPIVKRPASIVAISILVVVLGSLVVLCDGIVLIAFVVTRVSPDPDIAAMQDPYSTAPMRAFNTVEVLVGLALGAMLLAGGIGGIKLRPRARKLLVQWAVASLFFQPLTCAISLYFAISMTVPAAPQQVITQLGGDGQVMTYAYHGPDIGAILSLAIVSCVLPICVLIFWRRPVVVEAFEKPERPSANAADAST